MLPEARILMTKSVMNVYCFCNTKFSNGDESWSAYSETGVFVTSHYSSNRAWGIHDTSLEWKNDAYEKALGTEYVFNVIVLQDGEIPPRNVLNAMKELYPDMSIYESSEQN